jgi:uncharacterized protein (TIGR03118 family)
MLPNGSPAAFLFDSEDGAISGWNMALGNTAEIAVNSAASGAVYKGLAIDDNNGTLFATNFHSGMVEMYNSSFHLLTQFTDPSLPAGYAPFGASVLDGKLYVTYALQDPAMHDDVAGLGHGFVDVYNISSSGVSAPTRLISQGLLDSPWGLAIAPSTFGTYAGDLLVGNFGNGLINAYDPNTGKYEGLLRGATGAPIQIEDLWGLAFGASAADSGTLYFTAGLHDEGDGLFGSLTPGSVVVPVPEPGTWMMMLAGFAGVGFAAFRRNRIAAIA